MPDQRGRGSSRELARDGGSRAENRIVMSHWGRTARRRARAGRPPSGRDARLPSNRAGRRMRRTRPAARRRRRPLLRAARHVEPAVAAQVHACCPRDRQEDARIGSERGPRGLELVPVDLAPAPVAGEEHSAKTLRPTLVVHRQGTSPTPLAVGTQRRHDLVGKVGEPQRVTVVGGLDQVAHAHIPAGPVVGVVSGEKVQVRVDRDGEWVAEPDREDFQLVPSGRTRRMPPPRWDSVVPSFPFAPWNP